MRFLSLFSGIEAASVAWGPLGWKAAAFAEIEPFPCALLAHRYPDVPNLGDVTKYKEWPDLGTVDAVCGGSPCQSFSIAGLRQGLADPRGNLMLTFLGVVDKYQPRYVVWENVLGVLSSNGGRDFASFLGGLGQLGYGWCYRVLDAQYARVDGFPYAVPQRRRRVVLVGYLGDWRRAAAVLSEPESVLGDNPPRREAGKRIAPTTSSRPTGGGGLGTDFDLDGGLVAFGGNKTSGPVDVSTALQAHAGPKGRMDFASETFVVGTTQGGGSPNGHGTAGINSQMVDAGYIVPICFNSREDPEVTWDRSGSLGSSSPQAQAIAIQERAVSENPDAGPQGSGFSQDGAAYTLEARHHVQAVAFDLVQATCPTNRSVPSDVSPTVTKQGRIHAANPWAVRRLTPTECERLMGFPDDYTAIPYRGKPAADGPRYKALGNSWAVNVFRWVGRRIEFVEEVAKELNAA